MRHPHVDNHKSSPQLSQFGTWSGLVLPQESRLSVLSREVEACRNINPETLNDQFLVDFFVHGNSWPYYSGLFTTFLRDFVDRCFDGIFAVASWKFKQPVSNGWKLLFPTISYVNKKVHRPIETTI